MIDLLCGGLALTALALTASPVAAQYAPWCSEGAVSCTFYSFEQCMETVRGSSRSCSPNPNSSSGTPDTAAGQGLKRRRPR